MIKSVPCENGKVYRFFFFFFCPKMLVQMHVVLNFKAVPKIQNSNLLCLNSY